MTEMVVRDNPERQSQVVKLEDVLIKGDLSKLSDEERLRYYGQVCQSLGLNPFTKPFLYISFPQKGLQLYPTRDCTDQLRRIRGISVTELLGHADEDIYVTVAQGRDRDGRTDMATGAVPYGNLKGEARANAIMKSETKAKRRLTLSLAGLGWLDEVEVETIADTDQVNVDLETGEILPSTWEGRVSIGSRVPVDLVLHWTGDDDVDGEYTKLAATAENPEGEVGIAVSGFKLELPGRKSAQVVALDSIAEMLFKEEVQEGEYGSSSEYVATLRPGDQVRVTGTLSFVAWKKDGRDMPPFRRIVAESIEKL